MSYINNNSYFNPMQSFGFNGAGSNFGLQSFMGNMLGGMGGGMGGMMGMMYGGGQGGMQMAMLMALLMAALEQNQQGQQGQQGQGACQPQCGSQQPQCGGNQGYPPGSGAYGPLSPNFNSQVRNGNNWAGNGSYVSPQTGSGYQNPFQGGCGCQPCNSSPCQNGGQLQQSGSGQPITYTTQGGYKVSVNGSNVSYTTPDGKNVLCESGDPHETLNGTGVSQANRGSDANVNDEWTSQQHTIILGDGTRISMNAASNNNNGTQWNGTIQNTSIYEGNRDIQINNNGNQVTSDTTNAYKSASDQMNQSMGSTEYFGKDNNGGYTLTGLGSQTTTGGFTPAYQDFGNMGDTGPSSSGQCGQGGGGNMGSGGQCGQGGQGGGGNFWQSMWQDLEKLLGMGQYA